MQRDSKSYQILVVEDNPGDYFLVEEFLREKMTAPRVVRSESFKQAKTTIINEDNRFDIILLDLSLPDKEGEELIREAIFLSAGTPIIILTGFVDENFAVKSLSLGISDYLLKDDLNSTILYKSIIYNLERHKNLLKLKESEQRYFDLFHLSPLPMWVYDLETYAFLNVNQAAIEHYGYSYGEFMQMTILDIRPKEHAISVKEVLKETKKNQARKFRGVFVHQKKDGTLLEVEIISKFLDFQGRKARMVLANDMTEKLNYVKAIETQNEKLKSIAWLQSHVVRAPLARMMGLINLIKTGELSMDEKISFLDHIIASADEVDKVIRNIVNKAQKISFMNKGKPDN
ncbi:response regulator [Negadavirga shengliensis]|uniref:Response regulator n=1 Tax=Negadavirga shengliensis TaxID=1389218 RepID=A0ABV9SXB0_9BACT